MPSLFSRALFALHQQNGNQKRSFLDGVWWRDAVCILFGVLVLWCGRWILWAYPLRSTMYKSPAYTSVSGRTWNNSHHVGSYQHMETEFSIFLLYSPVFFCPIAASTRRRNRFGAARCSHTKVAIHFLLERIVLLLSRTALYPSSSLVYIGLSFLSHTKKMALVSRSFDGHQHPHRRSHCLERWPMESNRLCTVA